MRLYRIQQTTAATVSHTFYGDDEAPIDAVGNVTATLKRLDGTTVNTATAGHSGTGIYTYPVPAQANLDSLTLDWTGTVNGAAVSVRDYVEIVGGHLFELAHARTDLGLATAQYPTALLAAKRIEVEQELEVICRQAFVPRFHREVLSGANSAQLGTFWMRIRAVRAVSIGGTALSGADVAALGFSDHGVLKRPGGTLWPTGLRNIIVEYEHGWDLPPEDVRSAGILRLRSRLGMTSSAIPDRAISFTVAEGGVYRLSTPAKQRTGQPEVDGVLERYTRTRRAVFA